MKSEVLSLPSRLKPTLPALGVASLLAAGTNAYGQIVYPGAINTFISAGSSVSFNINAAAVNDFSLFSGGGEGGYLKFGSTGYFAAGLLNGANLAKVTGGASIGSGSSTWDSVGLNKIIFESYTVDDWGPGGGSLNGDSSGYVAFRFSANSGGALLYGWMQLTIHATGSTGQPTANVLGYAYEASGGSILAGAIPEPSAAALVIGAASLLALRQRRRKAA